MEDTASSEKFWPLTFLVSYLTRKDFCILAEESDATITTMYKLSDHSLDFCMVSFPNRSSLTTYEILHPILILHDKKELDMAEFLEHLQNK